jgi:hypothetical protein
MFFMKWSSELYQVLEEVCNVLYYRPHKSYVIHNSTIFSGGTWIFIMALLPCEKFFIM